MVALATWFHRRLKKPSTEAVLPSLVSKPRASTSVDSPDPERDEARATKSAGVNFRRAMSVLNLLFSSLNKASARILIAALVSRSRTSPHSSQMNSRSDNESFSFVCPQPEQVLLEGNHRFTFSNSVPYLTLLYSRNLRIMLNPQSEIADANL